MPNSQGSNALANGCMVLFSLPFIAMGTAFAYKGYRSLHDPSFKNPWIAIVFGSVFALIGCLIVVGSFYGTRLVRAAKARQDAYPQQPWMWREDWAQGRANGLGRNSARASWLFAAIWNAVCWTLGYMFWSHPDSRRPVWADLMIGLFCIIGVGAAVLAVTQTLRRMRYGTTFIALQETPAALGRVLRGTIDVPLPSPLPHGINLVLTCVNRVTTGTGNSRSTTDRILWQEKKTLGSEQVPAGACGSTIPVEFDIPRDEPSSDHSNHDNQILWLLRAEADVPGVDFDERYELPVFQTSSSPSIAAWQAKVDADQRQHPAAAPTRPTVQVSAAPDGGTQFYFPPGRNVSAAFWLTIFTCLFGVVSYFLWHVRAPLIFPIVFSGFTALMLLICVNLWFGSALLVVNASELSISTKMLGMGGTKKWNASEVARVYPKITMQSGGSGGIPYYTVTLSLRSNRDVQLGNALRDHNEAEWICERIREGLRLDAQKAQGAPS